MIKPGSVVYWEVTLFLNYRVRVWPLSLNNLHWFSMTISNKVNATQWVCLKMEPLHTENRVARSKNVLASHFSVIIRGCMLQCWETLNFWLKKKKKKNQLCFRAEVVFAVWPRRLVGLDRGQNPGALPSRPRPKLPRPFLLVLFCFTVIIRFILYFLECFTPVYRHTNLAQSVRQAERIPLHGKGVFINTLVGVGGWASWSFRHKKKNDPPQR